MLSVFVCIFLGILDPSQSAIVMRAVQAGVEERVAGKDIL